VREWSIDPEHHELGIGDVVLLAGEDPRANAERLERILADGADRAGRAAVLLNAAAAIYVSGIAPSYEAGVTAARTALASGAARAALERLRRAGINSGG
jgi:anthranilate phosphoribosyltransferase